MATMTGAPFVGARCCGVPRVQDLLSSSRNLQGQNAVNFKFKGRETSFRTGTDPQLIVKNFHHSCFFFFFSFFSLEIRRLKAKVLAVELPKEKGGNGEILYPSSAKLGSDLGMSSLKENDGRNVAEAQQKQLRNSLLRIGMVMSCPLLATVVSSVLEDYSSSAVALEANNIVAVSAAISSHWSSSFTFELLYKVGVPLADLDPGIAKLAITALGPFFAFFNVLFIFRIVMSWYPQIPVSKFPFVLAYAPTEPILGPTRRLIPPVGGVDVAPVIWVALMSFLNEILLGKQGLLILLSQQQ